MDSGRWQYILVYDLSSVRSRANRDFAATVRLPSSLSQYSFCFGELGRLMKIVAPVKSAGIWLTSSKSVKLLLGL